MKYHWENTSDRVHHARMQSQAPLAILMNGVDTVGKTEFSRAIEKYFGLSYFKGKESLTRGLKDAPALGVMGMFIGANREFVNKNRHSLPGTVMDPFDPVQVMARLRAEGLFDNLGESEQMWLESQAKELIYFLLGEDYDVLSIHLRADDVITERRLEGRVQDAQKRTPYDRFLHEHPDIGREVVRDITEQIKALSRESGGFRKNKHILFVEYDTSNAPGYPTNFDREELLLFLKYIREYFSDSTLPSMIWTPYQGEAERVSWRNDHMNREIIMVDGDINNPNKRTNWSIPVFQKEGKWHMGFGVDIMDFSHSSGEIRLKPWGGQVDQGDFSDRIRQKFRQDSAEIINASSRLLLPEGKKLVTPIWRMAGEKELTPHITELTHEQFTDIRSTPRYCKIISFPIDIILQGVFRKEGVIDEFFMYGGREYRLASGALDMLLLFAREKGIIQLN